MFEDTAQFNAFYGHAVFIARQMSHVCVCVYTLSEDKAAEKFNLYIHMKVITGCIYPITCSLSYCIKKFIIFFNIV